MLDRTVGPGGPTFLPIAQSDGGMDFMVMEPAADKKRNRRHGMYLARLLSLHEAVLVGGTEPATGRLLEILIRLEAHDESEVYSETEIEELVCEAEQEGFTSVDPSDQRS